jgi:hypothetical protein
MSQRLISRRSPCMLEFVSVKSYFEHALTKSWYILNKQILRQKIYIYDLMISKRVRMRSSRVFRASDSQCQSRNSPGFGTSTEYVHIKSTTVYVPSSELGLSQPLSRQRLCPSPQNGGRGGGHSPASEGLGLGGGPIPTKKLSTLPTLWVPASCDTVESEGRQMKQCSLKYIKIKVPQFFKHF